MVLNPVQYMDNINGAWLFAGLILFILFYLIKPKPREKVIPSLMFVMRENHTQKSNSFFQRFLRDILIFIHLLLLLMMAVAAMHPFYNTTADVAAEYTVLVLDNSASMSTKTGISTRLNDMISEAKDNLEGTISIILIQNEPYAILQDSDKSDALDVINSIPQSMAISTIGTSILAADDLLQDKKGKVIVISDFVNTDPLDPYIAKKSLEAKGNTIEFIPIRETANNVGIVDMETVDQETQITLMNYNDETENIDVEINGQSTSIEIPANWQQTVTFRQQEGLNKVIIKQNDDFMADNSITLSVPMRKETNILTITNNVKSFVYPVLQAYAEAWNEEATVEKGEPPVMPVVNHDVIVISEVSTDNLPSAVITKITDAVNEGAALIVTAQDDIDNLNLDDVLPVELGEINNRKVDVSMQNVLTAVTNGISITSVDKYMQATAKENTMTLAATAEGVPLIVIGSYGQGTVIWYGIFESNSTFKYDVTYPLFWQQLIDYIIGKDTVESLNYRIGEKVIFDNEIPLKTPSGKIETVDQIEFDEIGIYEYKDKQVAVNLLNKVESNIDYVNQEFEKTLVEEDTE
ncbi:MAG: BatA domain-containing protein, partial [Candidatus Woesearchaeota archaeon]